MAIDKYGDPLPEEQLEACRRSDAALLAAVGGEKMGTTFLWINARKKGLLRLRGGLGLFAQPPARDLFMTSFGDARPLKDEIVGTGLDILILRELTGDVYFGERGGDDITYSSNPTNYHDYEVERIARLAFRFARARGAKK